MTGPEHYREAQECRERAANAADAGKSWQFEMAEAQVHATLALAAATAMNDPGDGMLPSDWIAWREAASVVKAKSDVTS